MTHLNANLGVPLSALKHTRTVEDLVSLMPAHNNFSVSDYISRNLKKNRVN